MNIETKRGRRRGEIDEKVTRTQEDIQRIQESLGREEHDITVTRETLDQLEGDGTEEGALEVREAVEQAEDVTTEIFDDDAEELDGVHGEGRECEVDLDEGSESVLRDTERIGDVMDQVSTQENIHELERALDHAQRDKDLLDRHIERLQELIRQSESDYQDLYAQVHDAAPKGGGILV